MKNKKILIICTSLNMGGAEKQSVWLANKLSNNYDVYYFSLKSSGVLKKYIDEKVEVKNFHLKRSSNVFSKIFYVVIGGYRLYKLVKSENINHMITFLFHSNLYGKFVKLFTRHRINHVIAVRNDRLSKRTSKLSKLRTLVFKYFIIDKKSTIVFNSNTGQKKFNLGKKYAQTVILNSPSNVPNLSLKKNKQFIYVGRLDELKNTTELVKAIKYLTKKYNKITLDIFGKGPNYQFIKKFVEENGLSLNISLCGVDADISNKLYQYDCLILSSTHEGFPNVLIEAMNSKINCISTKVGDAPYLLEQDRGILIDGFDYQSIANSIEKYIELDKTSKKEMAEKSYDFVSKNLKEEEILSQWISLII